MADEGLRIVRVSTAADKRQFFRFPWTLYRRDPNWVPPLRGNEWALLGYRPHPFYHRGEIQTFSAFRGREMVGRIAAIIDQTHNEVHRERRGMFGFFETVDDAAVVETLSGAACEWLRSRGQTLGRGPANPSQNYTWGLLVEGFDQPPTFQLTYNPPYYAGLLERAGWQPAQDLYSYWGHVDMLGQLDQKLSFVANEAIRRFGLNVRPLDRKRFTQDVEAFMEIYNRALLGQWGFAPLTSAELRHIARDLRHLILPELTSIAEVDGRPIAAAFGILDYNPLIGKIDGRLFPFGFLRLLAGRRRLKRVRLVSTNVLPEYQKWGLGLVLMQRLAGDVVRFGIEEGEFSWVLESNHLSRKTLERGGAQRSRTFRIYDRVL